MKKESKLIIQTLLALMVAFGVAMGVSYWATTTSYNKKIDVLQSSYDERLNILTKVVSEKETEVLQMQDLRFWCTDCHQIVEQFHNPKDISILAVAKERKARVCVHCHGFSIHTIHRNKLDTGQLQCERCHFVEGKVIRPKPRPGDLLVCQQCHWEGNYIDIHINHGKATCLNCHVGGVTNVHKGTLMNAQKLLIGEIDPNEVDLSVVDIIP
ncbi:MAG: hypothetical protein V3V92_05340 [Candidatus Hydrothermarchaeales archaeon]